MLCLFSLYRKASTMISKVALDCIPFYRNSFSFTLFFFLFVFSMHDFPQGILIIAHCNPLCIDSAARELRYVDRWSRRAG